MSPDASFLDFTTRLTTKREVSALARERGFYIVQIKGYGYVGGGYNLKIFSEPGGSDVLARNESTISGGGGPIGGIGIAALGPSEGNCSSCPGVPLGNTGNH